MTETLFTLIVSILVIVHGRVFDLKLNFSETGFCLRLKVEPTHLDPICVGSFFLCTPAQRLVLSVGPKYVGST
jgi:hypothetical protein